MTAQQHVVFGAGLIGGYLAGGLTIQGLDTKIIVRDRTRDALQHGLTISDLQGHQTRIKSIQYYQQGNIDVLWLTVKCTAVSACVADLKKIVTSETLIICCQNGLGSDQIIRESFPTNTVLGAVVGFNVVEQTTAHLHRSTDGKLIIEYHSALEQAVTQLNCRLLAVQSSQHFAADQWAKLQLNIANPVNALANIPVKAMTEDPGYRKIIAALMEELLSVTQSLGLTLPKVTAVPANMIPRIMRLPNWLFTRIAQKMLAIDPTARTSMWWDLSQGKPSEIDFLNGAVVRVADNLGLACPLNNRIVELIRAVERGERAIGLSAQQLESELLDD